MKIPEDVLDAAVRTALPAGPASVGLKLPALASHIAEWALEQAARVAERFVEDIPDADQRVFADVGAAIRKLKETT